MTPVTPADLQVPSLGPCRFPAPGMALDLATEGGGWVNDADRVLYHNDLSKLPASAAPADIPTLERSGPRRRIFFDPAATTCAIVTCGGLCPGLNDVIRAIVMQAHRVYGLRRVLGLRYGYEGLNPELGHEPMELTPERVANIHRFGGSILGSSRGMQEPAVMAATLESLGIDILFVIGGDGSQKGAHDIQQEVAARGLPVSVIGVPKTIDNDLLVIDRSFGYMSAFSRACDAVLAAQCEAGGARNGVGLVKLMGRDSGFIACGAALATSAADFVLIPEVPFQLEGTDGLFVELDRALERKGWAAIIAAEGAGQDLCGQPGLKDASGNEVKGDIGLYLQDVLKRRAREKGRELNLKYIDPSYIIRSGAANAEDSAFCLKLGADAMHAAMSGRTGMVVGTRNGSYVHIPMPLLIRGRRKVNPMGSLWRAVLESTGQPAVFGD